MLAGVHDIELVSSHPSHHISSRRMEWWSRSGGFFLDLLIDGKCRCPVSVGPDLSVSSLSRDDISAQIIRYCDLKGSGGKNWLLGLAVVSEGGGSTAVQRKPRYAGSQGHAQWYVVDTASATKSPTNRACARIVPEQMLHCRFGKTEKARWCCQSACVLLL